MHVHDAFVGFEDRAFTLLFFSQYLWKWEDLKVPRNLLQQQPISSSSCSWQPPIHPVLHLPTSNNCQFCAFYLYIIYQHRLPRVVLMCKRCNIAIHLIHLTPRHPAHPNCSALVLTANKSVFSSSSFFALVPNGFVHFKGGNIMEFSTLLWTYLDQ